MRLAAGESIAAQPCWFKSARRVSRPPVSIGAGSGEPKAGTHDGEASLPPRKRTSEPLRLRRGHRPRIGRGGLRRSAAQARPAGRPEDRVAAECRRYRETAGGAATSSSRLSNLARLLNKAGHASEAETLFH